MSRVFGRRKSRKPAYSVTIALQLPEDNCLLEESCIRKLTCSVKVIENAEGVVTLVISGKKSQVEKALVTIRSKREDAIARILGVNFEETRFAHVHRMRKMRIPQHAIQNHIIKNHGVEHICLLELLNTPFEVTEREVLTTTPPPPESTHIKQQLEEIPPVLRRYERMFGVGCTPGQVRHKMKMNGEDPSFYDKYFVPREERYGFKKKKIDEFWIADEEEEGMEKNFTTNNTSSRLATSLNLEKENIAPHLKSKYFKMKKMGISAAVIKKCMNEAGVNPDLYEVFFSAASTPSSVAPPSHTGPPPVPEKIIRFLKMKKMGIPEFIIKQKMKMGGANPDDYDRYLSMIPGSPPPPPSKPIATPIPTHLERYARMLALGIPREAVINKMKQNGYSEAEFDKYFGDGHDERSTERISRNKTSQVCKDVKFSEAPKKKKIRFPKRERAAPSKKIRQVFVDRLPDRRVKKSSFWMDIVNRDLDDILEIDAAEIEYSMGSAKQKLNMSGFWYLDHISKPTVLEVQKGIVIYHNSNSGGNCKMEHILFDRNWGDYRINIGQSKGQSEIDDFIMWNHRNKTEELCVWQRYTNVMAVRSFLWESDLELPNIIVHLLQSFLGTKTYLLQREKKKKTRDKFGIVNARTLGDAQFALKLYKLHSEERMLEFRDCILALDQNRLFTDFGVNVLTIQQLANFFPSTEELQAVANVEYIDVLKSPVYQFFHILSTIPNLHQRMENWTVKIEFLDRLHFIQKRLAVFDDGARFWTESESLKLMFGLILKLCNFVNHGNRRGNAFGFHLTTLSILGKDFMNYLIVLADDKYPEALDFVEEFEQIKKDRVCDMHFADIRSDLNQLRAGLRKIERISEADRSHHNADKYVDVMQKFHAYAGHRIEESEFCCADIVARYQQLSLDFACVNDEFSLTAGRIGAFGQMSRFYEQVKKIMDQIQKQKRQMQENMKLLRYQQQKKEEVKERRARWKEEKAHEEEKKKDKPYDFMAEWKMKKQKPRQVRHIEVEEGLNPFAEIAEMKIRLDTQRAQKRRN